MNYEMIYNVGGVLLFVFIVYKVFKTNVSDIVKPKKVKKQEIVEEYTQKLKDELDALKDDKQAQVAKKSQLLKVYSDELSRNIFFEEDEVREIILELSKM